LRARRHGTIEKVIKASVRSFQFRPILLLARFAFMVSGCGDPDVMAIEDPVEVSPDQGDASENSDVGFDDSDAPWHDPQGVDVGRDPDASDAPDASDDLADPIADYIITPPNVALTSVKAPFRVGHEFPNDDDEFGHAVAISGDTVVIGVPGDDGHVDGTDRYLGILGDPSDNMIPTYDSGAVYVLDLEGNVIVYLKALDVAPQDRTSKSLGWADRLGTSVAIDGNIVVAGAPGWEDDAGKAYVFERDQFSGKWLQSGQLVPGVSTDGSLFGQSVTISGEVIIVGAPAEDGFGVRTDADPTAMGATDSGAAYVFERVDGYWRQTAYLKAFDSDAGDLFGTSVAIADDYIAVGAPLEASQTLGLPTNNHMRGSGAVYVYDRPFSSWRYFDMVKAPRPNYGDFFGQSVALDRGGDDVLRLAVGAPYANAGGQADAGAVTVFDFVNREWVVATELTAPNFDDGDRFGSSIALDDDYLVVGAPGESTWLVDEIFDSSPPTDIPPQRSADSGAAYVFKLTSSWNAHAYLKHVAYVDSFFGTSVAVDAASLALVVGQRMPELAVPHRAGAAVIAPVSPPRFNSDQQLPPTLPPGGGVTNF
jgi:hypothetical protein